MVQQQGISVKVIAEGVVVILLSGVIIYGATLQNRFVSCETWREDKAALGVKMDRLEEKIDRIVEMQIRSLRRNNMEGADK